MIFIDTREQANTHVLRAFNNFGLTAGFDYCDEKLDFGDYYNTDSGITVERKKNLIEFANNCGKGHAAFKAELERLRTNGGKMYILIEQDIQYDDIGAWENPRGKVTYRQLRDGTLKAIRPMGGKQIKTICDKWREDYNIEFVFCDKRSSGAAILGLLQWIF